MAKNLYGFSREEEGDALVEDTNVEPITVDDVIAAEEDAAELAELVADTENKAEAMDEGDAAVDELEEQVEVAETKTEESPEDVTVADAVVATESLKHVMSRLGMPSLADLGVKVVSHEAAAADPVTALRISTEGAKEIIDNIVNTVKEVFKRVLANIKKIYAKIMIMIDRTDKNADALLKSVAKATIAADAKFEEGDVKTIVNRLAVVAALGGGSISKDPSADIKLLLEGVSSSASGKEWEKAIDEQCKAAAEVIEKNDEASFQKLGKLVGDSLAASKTALSKKVGEYVGAHKSNFVSGVAEGDLTLDAIRFDGKSLKVVYTSKEDVEAVNKAIAEKNFKQAAATGTAKTAVITFSDGFLSNAKVEAPSKETLVKILKDLKATAAKKKSFTDGVFKAINASEKAMDKIAGSAGKAAEGNGAGKYAASLVAKSAKTFAINVALDSILGYLGTLSAVLKYCQLGAKLATGAEKKK